MGDIIYYSANIYKNFCFALRKRCSHFTTIKLSLWFDLRGTLNILQLRVICINFLIISLDTYKRADIILEPAETLLLNLFSGIY